MERLVIHPRVFLRHLDLNEVDVQTAWLNSYYAAIRPDSPNFPEYLWIGVDGRGREIEMVGVPLEYGSWLIYHANTPLSKRTLKEMKKARWW